MQITKVICCSQDANSCSQDVNSCSQDVNNGSQDVNMVRKVQTVVNMM